MEMTTSMKRREKKEALLPYLSEMCPKRTLPKRLPT